MSYKVFQEFWKNMSDDEKANYITTSSSDNSDNEEEQKISSKSKENKEKPASKIKDNKASSSSLNNNLEDEITIDDLEEVLNNMDNKNIKPSSSKAKKTTKK